jgi:hypothetical protein
MTRLFGDIVDTRLNAPTPDSFILEMLRARHNMLAWWESRACKYLAIIDIPEDAIRSLNTDLLGAARASNRANFDGRLKDALAEVCTAVELSLRGGSEFKRIQPPSGQGHKSPDFECLLKSDTGEAAHYGVEVKNLRAPVGILDLFKRLYDDEAKRHPEILTRSIQLSYYWDNTVTAEQEPIIVECFNQLVNCKLPLESEFVLEDEGQCVHVSVRVREGSGVSLSRGIGADLPWGPFTKRDKFLAYALEKIRQGAKQLNTRQDLRHLLVLNIESPDYTVEPDLLHELRRMVDTEFAGKLDVLFLLYYQWMAAANQSA